jgi:peptidyl-prolyl cis-trans isomerase B (cyclophilin B)
MKRFLLFISLTIAMVLVAAVSEASPSDPQPSVQQKRVLLETTAGNIVIALYDDTPIHRDNFLKLVGQHYYDSLLFHRVIFNFMIQTGSADSRHAEAGSQLGFSELDYTLEPEFRIPQHFHRRGAVAMAREGDRVNPERRSSACQFYIVWGKTYSTLALEHIQERLDSMTNGQTKITAEMDEVYRKYGGSPHLDGQYTVFGEVVEGLDVVDKIQQAWTDDHARPIDDIRILRAVILE